MPITGASGIDPNWVGNQLGQLVEDVPSTITIDKYGVAKGSLYFTTMFEGAVAQVIALTYHPDYNWLKRSNAEISREEAGSAKVRVDFEGVPPQDPDQPPDENQGYKFYSVRGALSTEPIETHPNFETYAGTRYAPVNGAEFDKTTGKFIGFTGQANAAQKKKFGVRSYYVPSVMYEESWVRPAATDLEVNLEDLGTAVAHASLPSSSVKPKIKAPRNWLLASCDVQEVGDGVQQSRAWRLSGPKAWDADWYGV